MFDVIENWEKRKVIGSINIEDLVSRVKNPTQDFKTLIDEARTYDRKSKEYKDIKSSLPCFSAGFNFRGYINKANTKKPTGYLYIDIDEIDTIDINHSSIVFCCKSLSGKGYSILVGVIGVTKDNLKQVTVEIAKELDVELDLEAISPDRLTVISYDINAYYNPEHTYFLYENGILKNPHYNTKHIFNISNDCSGGKLRKDNLDEIIKNIDFNGELYKKFEPEKIGYVKLNTPFNEVTEGKRNSTMNKLCYFLRGLNLDMDKAVIKTYLESINLARFSPPLSEYELSSIVDSVYRLESIDLYPNEFRRILYNPDYDLTTKEKRQLSMSEVNKGRVKKTISDIEFTIDNWDTKEKITQKTLSQKAKKDIKTIEKYYKLFKEKIKLKNLQNLN